MVFNILKVLGPKWKSLEGAYPMKDGGFDDSFVFTNFPSNYVFMIYHI